MTEVYKLLAALEKAIDAMEDIDAEEAMDHVEDWVEEVRGSRSDDDPDAEDDE